MTKTMDVVIIGAGANGASTAFHLAKSGVKRIGVFDRGYLASGATGKSGALVRTHYTNRPEALLAWESLQYFKNWKDMVGGDCGYQAVGMLVVTDPAYDEHLAANVAMHQSIGANARLITAEQAKEIDPSLDIVGLKRVAYEPESGYADPNETTQSFARAAMQQGVTFVLNTEVVRILTEGQRVIGVETAGERVLCETVIVAAGAWANNLFVPLGIQLGLSPSWAQVVIFHNTLERAPHQPVYLDRVVDFWSRPHGRNSTLVGLSSERIAQVDGYSEVVTAQCIAESRRRLAKRIPAMEKSVMRGGWAGVIMKSRDERPIIGKLSAYEGLYGLVGDSGTCFKKSPAIGKHLAELVTEGVASVDLTPFRDTRFAENALWSDAMHYGRETYT